MSGLVSALIMTPTYQSEELFEDHPSDSWVTAQLRSTRSKCSRHDQAIPLVNGVGEACNISWNTTCFQVCRVQNIHSY
jgi:hypothetical protein